MYMCHKKYTHFITIIMYILKKSMAHLNCHLYKRPLYFLNLTISSRNKVKPTTKIYAKSQGHTEVMNVHNLLSHGDSPMCQIWYAQQRPSCPDKNSW